MGKAMMFTLEEAQANGLEWYSWKYPAANPGDYICSEDDIVVLVKNRYDMTNNRGYPSVIYNTVAGPCYPNGAHFKCSDIYNGRNNLTNRANNRTKNRLSMRDKSVIDMILTGMSPVEAMDMVFNDKNITSVKWRVRQLLKRKEAVDYMGNKIKEKLESAGLTEAWWFEQLKGMIADPEMKSEIRWDMLKTAGQMHELIVAPSNAQLTRTQTLYLDDAQIDRLEEKQTLELNE